MPRRKPNIQPYYIRRSHETLAHFIRRLVKAVIAMYPYARQHGIRYYIDTEYRREIAYFRKRQKRLTREGRFHDRKVKKRVKLLLVERDGEQCNHCRVPFLLHDLTIDHIVRLFEGGTSDLENLQLLCLLCHKIKGRQECREDKRYRRAGFRPLLILKNWKKF